MPCLDARAEARRREALYQAACERGDRDAEREARDAANKAWWDAERAYLAAGSRCAEESSDSD